MGRFDIEESVGTLTSDLPEVNLEVFFNLQHLLLLIKRHLL